MCFDHFVRTNADVSLVGLTLKANALEESSLLGGVLDLAWQTAIWKIIKLISLHKRFIIIHLLFICDWMKFENTKIVNKNNDKKMHMQNVSIRCNYVKL